MIKSYNEIFYIRKEKKKRDYCKHSPYDVPREEKTTKQMKILH